MKAAWALAAAALVSVPILAVPAGPTVGAHPEAEHHLIGKPGERGDGFATGCSQLRDGAVTVEHFEFGKGLSLRQKPAVPCREEQRAG